MIQKLAKNSEDEQKIIDQVINLLKEHSLIQQLFDKYGVDMEFIHTIPIEFKDLDVSAKAKSGKIFINKSFLDDGNILDDVHYLAHEICHILQQLTGNITTKQDVDGKHYLDDPSEIEAFQCQIAFIASYKSDEEADKYVDDLLDFHNFKGKRRDIKRKQLRGE